MNDLMVGYCIISGLLFFFFIGLVSIVCDMVWNKEEIIITKKLIQKPEADPAQFISNDYEYDDDDLIIS
jgi:hypothetical protein